MLLPTSKTLDECSTCHAADNKSIFPLIPHTLQRIYGDGFDGGSDMKSELFHLDVRNVLNQRLAGRWIGRAENQDNVFSSWLSRSPDLTVGNFFIGSHKEPCICTSTMGGSPGELTEELLT